MAAMAAFIISSVYSMTELRRAIWSRPACTVWSLLCTILIFDALMATGLFEAI